jgi:hypothetical protein
MAFCLPSCKLGRRTLVAGLPSVNVEFVRLSFFSSLRSAYLRLSTASRPLRQAAHGMGNRAREATILS